MLKRFGAIWGVGVAMLGHATAGVGGDSSSLDLFGRLHACAAERSDARRLTCYDAQMRNGSEVRSGSDSQRASSSSSQTPAAPPPATFGMTPELQRKLQSPEERKAATPPQLDTLTAKVAAVSYAGPGLAVIKLDNAQVWQQMESDTPLHLNVGQPILIKRGALGSFYLTTPLGFALRVKRIH